MMTFAALMSLITAAVLLILLGDDIWRNGFRPNPEDRTVDVFMFTGFVCIMVVAGNYLLGLHY